MVIVFDAQVALTPVGRPFAPLTPSLDIPVAPVVVWVTVPIELLTQTDGDEEAADAETLHLREHMSRYMHLKYL